LTSASTAPTTSDTRSHTAIPAPVCTAAGGGGERLRGHVGAEHQRVVAGFAQQVADHPERDHVQLPGRRREHHQVLRALIREPRRLALEREHADRDLGGDVLLGDRDLLPLPQLAREQCLGVRAADPG
jgi:hypothetical protein